MQYLSWQDKKDLLKADIGREIPPIINEPIVKNGFFEGYVQTTFNDNHRYMMLDRPINVHMNLLSHVIDRRIEHGYLKDFLFEPRDIKSDAINLNGYLPTPLMVIDTSTPKLTPGLYNWSHIRKYTNGINGPIYQYTRTSWGEFRAFEKDGPLYLHGTVYERITSVPKNKPKKVTLRTVYIKEYSMGVLTKALYYEWGQKINSKLLLTVHYEYGYLSSIKVDNVSSINADNVTITKLYLFNETPRYIVQSNFKDYTSYEFMDRWDNSYLINYSVDGKIYIQYPTGPSPPSRNDYYRGNFEGVLGAPKILREYLPIKDIIDIVKGYLLDTREITYIKGTLEKILIRSKNDETRDRINKELTTINSILE